MNQPIIFSASCVGHHGRTGNQLFQIMSVMGLAEKYGAQAVFPKWDHAQYFETPISHGEMQPTVVKETQFNYYDWNLTKSCDIFGYLQSEKYFGSTKLKLKPQFVEDCKKVMPIFDKKVICIQVRRGDYVGNTNYYQIPATFYMDALLTHFPDWKDYNLLFMSDDIEYCRTHFECLPNAYFSTNSEMCDLALGSACDHYIISNSTFGWWCAWLGEKPGTKIIHSGRLMDGDLAKANPNQEDFRPERWINFKKDAYRLDMRDTTFTIPVFLDHQDRRDNLELVLCLLQRELDTNIIIGEQGGKSFSYVKKWVEYKEFPGMTKFHRTKMLNEMAIQAETPYIVNYDCDVIIPPAQLYMAVEQLRDGADMVFPFDGRFGRMLRNPWFKKIQTSLDIGVVGNTMFKNRTVGHNSVGGAVMFNRNSFIDGGMENENMISFGPEDCERNDRFKKLGYDIKMTPGSLFHMDHHVGINSCPTNPYFKANHVELEKIRAATKEELRAYVDTWPWRHKYTTNYYHRISAGSQKSAKIVFELLDFKPKSVFDVGGGIGEWNNGIEDYICLDYRIVEKDLLIPKERFIECDLNKDFCLQDRKFDLALCLEVAEHINPRRAEGLVEYLCSLSDRVLFSAAIPYQGGTGHVNENFQSWWAKLFKDNGFGAAENQPQVAENKEIELWYRNNIVLYTRGATGIVKDQIIPEYYIEIAKGLSAK